MGGPIENFFQPDYQKQKYPVGENNRDLKLEKDLFRFVESIFWKVWYLIFLCGKRRLLVWDENIK